MATSQVQSGQGDPAGRLKVMPVVVLLRQLLEHTCEPKDGEAVPLSRTLPLRRCLELGADPSLLLWLLYLGHIEHLTAGLNQDPGQSASRPCPSLRLSEESCFVLTRGGEAVAEEFLTRVENSEAYEVACDFTQPGSLIPRYDGSDRAFRWGPYELKRFRQPSVNQEIILCTAEELHWPRWFDDPLPREKGKNPKVRLHDTIKALNRNQKPYLIHFMGDGTGRRIGWEFR